MCLLLFSIGMKAQEGIDSDSHIISISIPEVAILDIESESSKDIALEFVAPTEAGMGVTGSSNNSLWLNYSSIKSKENTSRTVSVRLDETIPGADIWLDVQPHAGNGGGSIGEPSGKIVLTTSDQFIINNIGSCYTGNGMNNGHNLVYELQVSGSYEDLEAVSQTPLTVTYTISN